MITSDIYNLLNIIKLGESIKVQDRTSFGKVYMDKNLNHDTYIQIHWVYSGTAVDFKYLGVKDNKHMRQINKVGIISLDIKNINIVR